MKVVIPNIVRALLFLPLMNSTIESWANKMNASNNNIWFNFNAKSSIRLFFNYSLTSGAFIKIYSSKVSMIHKVIQGME